MSGCPFHFTRRGFLTGMATAVAAAGAGFGARGLVKGHGASADKNAVEAFYGARQSGIVTPSQSSTYFASFDLGTDKRDDVVKLLQKWPSASARMTLGQPADNVVPAQDDDP